MRYISGDIGDFKRWQLIEVLPEALHGRDEDTYVYLVSRHTLNTWRHHPYYSNATLIEKGEHHVTLRGTHLAYVLAVPQRTTILGNALLADNHYVSVAVGFIGYGPEPHTLPRVVFDGYGQRLPDSTPILVSTKNAAFFDTAEEATEVLTTNYQVEKQ
jgi:hypothetical protein